MKHPNRFNKILYHNTQYEESKLQTLQTVKYHNSWYVWGLKVSSRVMDERCNELKLNTRGISFTLNLPHYVQITNRESEEVNNIFFLVRNGLEKVYTGILEVSKFKNAVTIKDNENTTWKIGWDREKYEKKLRTYLIKVYEGTQKGHLFDGHHGRYHESLYYLSKAVEKGKIHLIDIDHKDFYMCYDILSAKPYEVGYHYRPKIHTNLFGYSIVESMINSNLDTEWGQFWYKIGQSEQAFYTLLKKRFPSVDRQEFENLLHKELV